MWRSRNQRKNAREGEEETRARGVRKKMHEHRMRAPVFPRRFFFHHSERACACAHFHILHFQPRRDRYKEKRLAPSARNTLHNFIIRAVMPLYYTRAARALRRRFSLFTFKKIRQRFPGRPFVPS